MKLTARDSSQLGHVIRQLRKSKGLTQLQLAKQASVRQATISDLENGKRGFTDVLLRVFNALGVELIFEAVSEEGEVFNPAEFYGKKEKGA